MMGQDNATMETTKRAAKIWYAGNGRDYAVMQNGAVLSVNARGLDIVDVRWVVLLSDGTFIGDETDAECLIKAGYKNVQRYAQVVAPGKL